MTKTTLHNGERFQLICYGNGIAYSLTHKPLDMQTYVQGDDAIAFENDFQAIQKYNQGLSLSETCEKLWLDCEWMLAAQDLDGCSNIVEEKR